MNSQTHRIFKVVKATRLCGSRATTIRRKIEERRKFNFLLKIADHRRCRPDRKKEFIGKISDRRQTSKQIIEDFLDGNFTVKEDDEEALTTLQAAFADHGVELSAELAWDIGEAFERGRIQYALNSRRWYRDGYHIMEDRTPSDWIVEKLGPIKSVDDEASDYEPESDTSYETDESDEFHGGT